jgi:cellulose synthase/poly-beta-1,6-N-acetylglucosamine synthase-like glycosyltransferase
MYVMDVAHDHCPEESVHAPRHRVAVLIACRNGAGTIGGVVAAAVEQADVYVVSDGSTDHTAAEAERAGAVVLARPTSGGKPDALRLGNMRFRLTERYDYIAVLDDDTTIAPDYLEHVTRRMDADAGIAVASGRIDSVWPDTQRWNPFVAMRAFMYWSYQATIKRGQNVLRVVNVICGANSVFRANIFARLIEQDTPYAIDDMFWLAEIVRARLGRVEYVHDARSWTIDPHTFRDWYRQTVRWSWGQFQSIRGHRLGLPIRLDGDRRFRLRFSWFDAAYLALLVDWLPYMLEPLLVVPAAFFLGTWINPLWIAAFYLGSSFAWIAIAATVMRKPQLILLAPAIVALDLVYRLTMLHAFGKAIVQPRVEQCKWDSPTRFDVTDQGALQPALTREGSST